MNKNVLIGLYHPMRMNREGIAMVLNVDLANRVKCVDHLYDLFSSTFSMVLLIEPEILSMAYNSDLLVTFVNHIKKPVIIVPYDEKRRKITSEKVTYSNLNPRPQEIVALIQRTEDHLNSLNRA